MDLFHSLPANLYDQVTRGHEHRFRGPHAARRGELLLDSDWRITLDRSCAGLAALAAEDLAGTLDKVFNIGPKRPTRSIHVVVKENPALPQESSVVDVAGERISITASDDEGAMRALFNLRWQMLNRQAPILKTGSRTFSPAWSIRITSPVVHRGRDEPEDYLALPDAYLLNVARYGYNATYLYADWFDFMSEEVAGPLARRGVRMRINALRKAVDHLGRFGIRLLMHVNTLALPHDHPMFLADPKMRGAQTWRDGSHCLCSSRRETKNLYRNAARQLMTDVPGLAGMVMITGGECFLHCYTRPMPQTSAGTNCPRCAKRAPDDVIAGVVNAVTIGARQANPDAQLFMWPYSAFTWGDLPTQQRLLGKLDKRIAMLAAYEKDDWATVDGVKAYVFDYSISQLGPSPRFRKLQKAAEKQGLAVYAKTENSQCIEMFNVPRIPIMHRWAERFASLRRSSLAGIHTTWRFYGFCAQRNDDIVHAFTWEDKPDVDGLLAAIARRDFGESAGRKVAKAWRVFSDAFAEFPYCAGLTGFPYFRGPFSLGPAHPFLFDLSAPHRLPAEFWAVDPSSEESRDRDAIAEEDKEPRFFFDLTWTQPYGAKRVADALARVQRGWRRGVSMTEAALELASGANRSRVRDEYAVASMIGCMIDTACNLVRFQMLRDAVTAQPSTLATLRRTCLKARQIVNGEIDNAKHALSLVKEDPSLGYGATYGRAFTTELIEAKITHARFQVDEAIPGFYNNHSFHCFGLKDRSL